MPNEIAFEIARRSDDKRKQSRVQRMRGVEEDKGSSSSDGEDLDRVPPLGLLKNFPASKTRVDATRAAERRVKLSDAATLAEPDELNTRQRYSEYSVLADLTKEDQGWWRRAGSTWRELYDAIELPEDLPENGSAARPTARCTAHTILLVDRSRSMLTADVKNKGSAAMLTREHAVRQVLFENVINPQLACGATRERVSLIEIRSAHKANSAHVPFALFPFDHTVKERVDQSLGEPDGHGLYLPALQKLRELVKLAAPYLGPYAETNVFFLSDGRPSDSINELELPGKLAQELKGLHALCGARLFVHLVGIGESAEQGGYALKCMAKSLDELQAQYELDFIKGKDGLGALASTMDFFTSSLTSARLSSVSPEPSKARMGFRRLKRSLLEHRESVYSGCRVSLPPLSLGDFGELRPMTGSFRVQIQDHVFGQGGERNVHLMNFKEYDPKYSFSMVNVDWVVKESKHKWKTTKAEFEFNKKGLVTQNVAKGLAAEFNKQAEMFGLQNLPKVSYMICCLIQTGRTDVPAADEPLERLLFAERRIPGQFYKWNTNYGTTSATAQLEGEGTDTSRISSDLVPQAFSHFSYEFTRRPTSQFIGPKGQRGPCLVCDIQGCYDQADNTFKLMDPVVHSDLGQKGLFGDTDRGAKGIDDFLASHKCNQVCRWLQLPENKRFVREEFSSDVAPSKNTSLISIVQTNHLQLRMHERDIVPRELQAAKKHGSMYRSSSGNIRNEHGDTVYVTSRDMKVGITAMRKGGGEGPTAEEADAFKAAHQARQEAGGRPEGSHAPFCSPAALAATARAANALAAASPQPPPSPTALPPGAASSLRDVPGAELRGSGPVGSQPARGRQHGRQRGGGQQPNPAGGAAGHAAPVRESSTLMMESLETESQEMELLSQYKDMRERLDPEEIAKWFIARTAIEKVLLNPYLSKDDDQAIKDISTPFMEVRKRGNKSSETRSASHGAAATTSSAFDPQHDESYAMRREKRQAQQAAAAGSAKPSDDDELQRELSQVHSTESPCSQVHSTAKPKDPPREKKKTTRRRMGSFIDGRLH